LLRKLSSPFPIKQYSERCDNDKLEEEEEVL